MSEDTHLINDPFFIVYHARSGSTFLANLLIKHADIAIPPETNFVTSILARYPKQQIENKDDLENVLEIVGRDMKFSDWNIECATIETLLEKALPISIRDFVLSVCTMYKNDNFPEAGVFGIKKGSYIRYYEKIIEIFPTSKFIRIIRDGRAVFNSGKHSIQSGTGKPFEVDPFKAARDWCETLRLLKEAKKNHDDTMLIIHYEEMIEAPEQVIKTICDFLNVSYDPQGAKDRRYVIPERYGNLHQNTEKSAIATRISAWEKSLSSEEVKAFESVAYRELMAEGYEVIDSGLVQTP